MLYRVECVREVVLEIEADSNESAERKAEALLELPDARLPDWEVTAWESWVLAGATNVLKEPR